MRIDAPQIAEIGDVFVSPPEVRLPDLGELPPDLAARRDETLAIEARLLAMFNAFIAAPKPETD